MSSALHLPHQVIPVILDSQRSQRFVIRCPMHALRFLLAARDVEELASDTSARLQDAVAHHKKASKQASNSAAGLRPLSLVAVTRSDRGSVRISLEPGPAALQAACCLQELGWPPCRAHSSKADKPHCLLYPGCLFKSMDAYLKSKEFEATLDMWSPNTYMSADMKRRLEGLEDFAAAIAQSARPGSDFDAACQRLLQSLKLQHGLPLHNLLSLLSQREVLQIGMDSRCKGSKDGFCGNNALVALDTLNCQPAAAQGLWGAILDSSQASRTDWMQAAEMIREPPTPQHSAWLKSLGFGSSDCSDCKSDVYNRGPGRAAIPDVSSQSQKCRAEHAMEQPELHAVQHQQDVGQNVSMTFVPQHPPSEESHADEDLLIDFSGSGDQQRQLPAAASLFCWQAEPLMLQAAPSQELSSVESCPGTAESGEKFLWPPGSPKSSQPAAHAPHEAGLDQPAPAPTQHPADARQRKARSGPANATSAYLGVTRYKRTGRYEAHIWEASQDTRAQKGRQIHLGSFASSFAAARAYDMAALKMRGVYAKRNFEEDDLKGDLFYQTIARLDKGTFVRELRKAAQVILYMISNHEFEQ
ncbi:hypothetical protein WJX74_009775 [Apatococcus lobatus]|uniref:AP2/ERF domain-containing protein n=1 Tax=Apatococcus lobatus TaxID=904363 RepID=A0AAW1QHC2_9CHLO